jgi:broad specificity phosphatase PhoE
MLVYFVRHGQTPSNVEHRFQTAETPLSAEGEIQAGKVAERLKNVTIDQIWTSPMRRAQHTAEIINQYHHIPVIEKPELKEMKRASIFEGKLASDPSIQHIQNKIWEKVNDPFFSFEDGESFADLAKRAKQFIHELEEYAKQKDEQSVLCVTAHGIVLSTILTTVLLGKYATPHHIREALNHFKIENTGVSVISTHHETWRVVTLNDFAHL